MVGIAIACLVLAKEKLVVLAVSAGFVALKCVWAFATGMRGVALLITFFVTAGVTALILLLLSNRRLSYQYPEKTGTVDLVVGLGSLVGTIGLKLALDRFLV